MFSIYNTYIVKQELIHFFIEKLICVDIMAGCSNKTLKVKNNEGYFKLGVHFSMWLYDENMWNGWLRNFNLTLQQSRTI